MQETWVLPLVEEDPLEKEMATHSSILAWRSPWTKEPSGLQSMGLQELDATYLPAFEEITQGGPKGHSGMPLRRSKNKRNS